MTGKRPAPRALALVAVGRSRVVLVAAPRARWPGRARPRDSRPFDAVARSLPAADLALAGGAPPLALSSLRRARRRLRRRGPASPDETPRAARSLLRSSSTSRPRSSPQRAPVGGEAPRVASCPPCLRLGLARAAPGALDSRLWGGLSTTVALLAAVLSGDQLSPRAKPSGPAWSSPTWWCSVCRGSPGAHRPARPRVRFRAARGAARPSARLGLRIFAIASSQRDRGRARSMSCAGATSGSVRGRHRRGARRADQGERARGRRARASRASLRVSPSDIIALPSPRDDAPTLTVVGTFDSPVALYTSDVLLVERRATRERSSIFRRIEPPTSRSTSPTPKKRPS